MEKNEDWQVYSKKTCSNQERIVSSRLVSCIKIIRNEGRARLRDGLCALVLSRAPTVFLPWPDMAHPI